MRAALLDLGTNTFHLLIADVEPGHGYTKIYKGREPVKLLEGSAGSGLIRPVPFERGVKAMSRFAKKISKLGVQEVFAFATSAVRSSSNGKDFLAEVEEQTNIRVKVISGEEEAEYIYYGVKQYMTIGNEPSLVLDIGGGSNELIICNDEKIFWKKSYNLGAARMIELFNPSDPITDKEIVLVENYFEHELGTLVEAVKNLRPVSLIGSSGSFDTFAAMIDHRHPDQNISTGNKNYEFNLDHYREVHEELLRSTLKERRKMKGLVRMRVDMIVLASIFTNFVIRRCGFTRVRLSKGALKEGMLWHVVTGLSN